MSFLDNPIPVIELQNGLATSGVYAIWCQPTDTYYIGQSVIVASRINSHLESLRRGDHGNDVLQADYDTHGIESLSVELLVEIPDASPDELRLWETKEIQRFSSHGQQLYNKTGFTINTDNKPTIQNLTAAAERVNKANKAKAGTASTKRAHRDFIGNGAVLVCYDCGMTGELYKDLFMVDGHPRCEHCTNRHLELWVFKPKRHLPQPRTLNVFMRWHMLGNPYQQLRLAIKRYAEKNDAMPVRCWLNPEQRINADDLGIRVEYRPETPFGYVDVAR